MNDGNELTLLLDCRTRWNSAEKMIERYLKISEAVQKALSDLNLKEHLIDEREKLLLQELLATLGPVRIAVEKLSGRDGILLTSEAIVQFVFDELKSQSSIGNISNDNEVYMSLSERINQRRNKEIVTVMKYLQNKNLNPSCDELPTIPKKNVIKLITELAEQFFAEVPAAEDEGEGATTAVEQDLNGEYIKFEI